MPGYDEIEGFEDYGGPDRDEYSSSPFDPETHNPSTNPQSFNTEPKPTILQHGTETHNLSARNRNPQSFSSEPKSTILQHETEPRNH